MKSLISYRNPKSIEAEAYRMLKTNLQYFNVDKDTKKIVISSGKTKEGKTTTIANLGITLAQSGNKVIIVDCDMRKPKINQLFRVSNSIGLTSVFRKEYGIGEVIKNFDIQNLDILPCGPIPPMPLELIESKTMGKILEALSEVYDYVLIDTPPVLSVTDACVMAQKSDGVLLAVSYRGTKIPELKASVNTLNKANVKILGTVLTKVEMKKNRSFYYSYEYGI